MFQSAGTPAVQAAAFAAGLADYSARSPRRETTLDPNPATTPATTPVATGTPDGTLDAPTEPQPAKNPPGSPKTPFFDRHMLIILLAATLIFAGRAALTQAVASETTDDQWHALRGLRYLDRNLQGAKLNDPAFGGWVNALPLWLTGATEPADGSEVMLFNQPAAPEVYILLTGVLKSLLFVPVVLAAFHAVRTIYGSVSSGYVAVSTLAAEPMLAAHLPVGTVDSQGLMTFLLACFAAWHYFAVRTRLSFFAATLALAAALMTKHTAIILPAVILGFAFLWDVVRPVQQRRFRQQLPRLPARLKDVALCALMTLVFMWALTLFEWDRGHIHDYFRHEQPKLAKVLRKPLPAGSYIGSITAAYGHSLKGHSQYLLGELQPALPRDPARADFSKRPTGWWYYFPLVWTYKTPLALMALFGMTAASVFLVKPRFGEWVLVLPLVGYTAFMIASPINIGFRHFIPVQVLLALLAGRNLAVPLTTRLGKAWAGTSVGLVVIAFVSVSSWHPYYMPYLNEIPRDKPWLDISDSNLDFGTGLVAARHWLEANDTGDRPVYVMHFGRLTAPNVEHFVASHFPPGKVTRLEASDPPPADGLLIISAVFVSGLYDGTGQYHNLGHNARPDALIGNGMMHVYDMDRLASEGFEWSDRGAASDE
ncbi:MAG: hypothetical protein ACFCVE_11670 [Phycisphaerae bacterium]